MAWTVLCNASLAILCNSVSLLQTTGQGRAAGGGTPDFGSRIQSTLQNVGSTLQQSASRMTRELPFPPNCCADTALLLCCSLYSLLGRSAADFAKLLQYLLEWL